MKLKQFLVVPACAMLALTITIPLSAEEPSQPVVGASESTAKSPIEWDSKNKSIEVFAWQTPKKVWRYGALEGAHRPRPSIATLEKTAHCFDSVEALVLALPKGRTIIMSHKHVDTPNAIRRMVLLAAHKAGKGLIVPEMQQR